jgi:DNA invertase Pin-like site-specific DNA recombinase
MSMTPTKELRVAIYVRVSTFDTDDETASNGQHLSNQIEVLKDRIERTPGWNLTLQYVDECSAGGKKQRPAFTRMLEDARAQKFDVLLFWSLDRLSREGTVKTLNYLQELHSLGISWVSHTQEFLNSLGILREAIVGLLAALAQQESQVRSERAKAAHRRMKSAGIYHRLGRKLREIPRDEVKALANAGHSLAEIQNVMKERGFTMSRTGLHRIITGKNKKETLAA